MKNHLAEIKLTFSFNNNKSSLTSCINIFYAYIFNLV